MWFIAGTKGTREVYDAARRLLETPREGKESERMEQDRYLAEIRQALREELQLAEAGAQPLPSPVAPSPLPACRPDTQISYNDRIWQAWFERYAGSQVIVQTPGGTIEGTIIEALEKAGVIEEPGGMIVIVFYRNLISLQPNVNE